MAQQRLDKIFDFELKLFYITGVYPLYGKNAIYYAKKIITYTFSFGQLLSMIIYMLSVNDLFKIIDVSYFCMTQTAYCWKLAFFDIKQREIQDLLDFLSLDRINNQPDDLKVILNKHVPHFRRSGKTFRILCVSAICGFCLFPFADPNTKFPLNSWYPFDENVYWIPVYITQNIAIAMNAYNDSTIDIMIAGLLSVSAGLFERLKNNLEKFPYAEKYSPYEEESYRKLVAYIKHHDEIIRFTNMIEASFSGAIFIQFLASALVICLTGFQMLVIPPTSVQFILLISYFMCMMTEVSLYCWYGNEVLLCSEEVKFGCFSSEWYKSSPRIQKLVFMIIQRAKKPVTVTAWKLLALSLGTLAAIMRSSYSYFAVLQRMYTKNTS